MDSNIDNQGASLWKNESIFQGIPEADLIIDAIRAFIHGNKYEYFPSVISLQRASRLLRQQNLEPIFAVLFAKHADLNTTLRCWQESRRITWIRNTRALTAATRVFDLLEKEDIQAVALRGVGVANYLYKDISLRPFSDVDILIRSTDKERLVEVLSANSLHPVKKNRSQWVYYIDGTKFEIHWSFLSPKRHKSIRLDEQFLESRRLLHLDTSRIFILNAENEFIGLLLHAMLHHELDSLLPLVDLAMLIKSTPLDWDYLSRWWQDNHFSNLFIFICLMVKSLFALEMDFLIEYNLMPKGLQKCFYRCFMDRILGADSLSSFLVRRLARFYFSETLTMKTRQLVRLFSFDEAMGFICSFGKTLHG